MRKMNPFLLSFALVAFALLGGCTDNDEPENIPAPPPPPAIEEPKVSLTAGEVTLNSVSVVLTSEHAEEVKWICYSNDQAAPDTAAILRDGTAAEPNREVEIIVGELSEATTYTFVAVAVAGELQTRSNSVEMTTLEPEPLPEPTVALEFVAVSETTATFRLTTTDAETAKWIYIEKGSRDLQPEQVLQHGTSAEANTTIEITAEGLLDDTEYEFYAVAAAGEVIVMSEAMAVTTPKLITTYTVNADSAKAQVTHSTSYSNFYITFEESATKYMLMADLYAASESIYFPSGEYPIGAIEPGNLSKSFTVLRNNGVDVGRFNEGTMTVVATPNEETRTVNYAIEANFVLEDGNLVVFSYNGKIEGISLPSSEIPEGYTSFEPDPVKKEPERTQRNGEVPGQYTLKFADKDWNELTLEFLIDPALCDNGNAALPAGTYSIAEGTVSTYSNVALYKPYWSASFTECEAVVSCDGETYTIEMRATGSFAAQEKKIWMKYSGPFKNMVR